MIEIEGAPPAPKVKPKPKKRYLGTGSSLDNIFLRPAPEYSDSAILSDWIAWPIEWPSYWWLVQFTGLATGIPDTSHVPCKGSGPMHVGSIHPTYKDCALPDWKRANTAPWRTQ